MKAFINSLWFDLLTLGLCFLMGYQIPGIVIWLFGYDVLALWIILLVIPLSFMAGSGVNEIKKKIRRHINEPVDQTDK